MPRPSLARTIPLAVAAAAVLAAAAPRSPATRVPPPMPFHPHFQKKLECRVADALTVTVRYQTVTFDREGAAKMQPGQAWHLAGAVFETTADVRIGGKDVAAGAYALSARKTDGGWELTLHEGRGFSRPQGEGVIALATKLASDAPLFEHLNIDVQPAGDKEHTRLSLDVRFDTLFASALIEVPAG